MRDLGLELLMQGAAVLLYTVIAGVLAGAGLFIEYQSYAYFTAGDAQLALWIAAIGVVALAAAGMVVRDKLVGAATVVLGTS